MRELSKEYLLEHYINLGKTRYQISAETGVDPSKIGSMLQQYGIRRYTVNRHGLCTHPLNVMWRGMKERCQNPNAENYKWYGGIGISICDEWQSFENFYNWAVKNGWRNGLSIDRINGNFGYSPDNCRFVDISTQCRNRKTNVPITVNGETHLQIEWCEILGLQKHTIAKWKYRHGIDYVISRIESMRYNQYAERLTQNG